MDASKQPDRGAAEVSGSRSDTAGQSIDEGATKEKIWVAVRVRPLLEQEQLARERVAWKAVGIDTLQHVDSDRSPTQCLSYHYNRVFSDTCSSEQVYQLAAQRLVRASLRGYNGTIFAYGQTGSGKTYTMQSIMAHAAKDIFTIIAEDASHEFLIRMTAIEVYNEVVRDLSRDNSPALKLLDDPAKGTVAENLNEEGVQSVQHLQQLLAEVDSRRQVRATRLNDNSSRSHAIIRLYIESRPSRATGVDVQRSEALAVEASDTDVAADTLQTSSQQRRAFSAITQASLCFVDLAGSERTTQAADSVEKDKLRQKEATNINKSLLTLSSVVRALADNPGKRHIPYRESKLTRLLQSSISGNAYISCITTISPAATSVDNTRAALHFATAAGRVVLKPQANRLAGNKAMLRALDAEIEQLKAQLATSHRSQRDTEVAQQESKSDGAAQEQDALHNKLQHLESQILRGRGIPNKVRCSLDSSASGWHNRVEIARELRASTKGLRSSWAIGDLSHTKDTGMCSGDGRPSTADKQQPESDAVGYSSSQLRRSMRLLDCYLVRGSPGENSTRALADAGSTSQLQQTNLSAKQQHLQPQWQRIRQQRQQPGRQFSGASILEQAAIQQHQQQEVAAGDAMQQQQLKSGQHSGSRLNPARQQQTEEAQIALQMQKLQEPSGPEAEAAMAGLEVEARCYKHVQDYTLDELVAALEHLESQQAAGEGLGSWSDEQLEALRSEVARKRAAEALTRMGDRALDALTRKVNSYTSSAEGSPFGDMRRQLIEGSSRDASMLDTPAAAAALASAAAAGLASWLVAEEEAQQKATAGFHSANEQACNESEAGPRLMSGRTTPTLTGRRNAGRAASVAVVPSAAAAGTPASKGRRPSSASRQSGTSPANSGSGSSAGSRRSTPSPGSSAAAAAQEQLVRMQEAWRESVEKDVSCLREVLAQYKEQVERLEMQKKLLLSQVLKLEFSLEEQESRVSGLQQQLQQAQHERDAARAAAGASGRASAVCNTAAGSSSAAGDTPGGGSATPSTLPAINTSPPLHHLSIYDACSDDGWASTPTVDSLLPKIVTMWEELYVPLAYRSRFFLAFRGREVFYYEVEARRLEWKRSQMLSGATEEPSVSGGWPDQQLGRGSFGGSIAGDAGPLPGTPTQGSTPRHYTSASAQAALTASSSFGGMRRRSRQLDKAARALDWERKSLAAGLKWNLTETEREELYRSWGVDPDTKERKLQLVFKLWSKDTLQQPDGMARSAELVVMLCGMDASEHMMELVFGGHLREYSAAGLLANRSSSSGLGLAVSNIVRRLAPPLARSGMGTSPMRSSVSLAGGHAGHNMPGVYGPQRTGGSFTSKLQSGFLSLLSSKDRQELGSHVQSREGSFSSLASSQAVPYRR